MVQYRRKISPTVDAYPCSTGGWVVIENGLAIPYPKESFEENFESVPIQSVPLQ